MAAGVPAVAFARVATGAGFPSVASAGVAAGAGLPTVASAEGGLRTGAVGEGVLKGDAEVGLPTHKSTAASAIAAADANRIGPCPGRRGSDR
jgi:hypothetical protein